LKGEPSELTIRLLPTGRDAYTSDHLHEMQEKLATIYDCAGVIPLDTRGMSIAEVTKRVAEIIHFHNYEPCLLGDRLRSFI
jgi:hypothetical protein